jgi:hypothetical protein
MAASPAAARPAGPALAGAVVGQAKASPELEGAAAFCELVLCPRRVGLAHAHLGRAGCPRSRGACLRNGRPEIASVVALAVRPRLLPQRP